MAGPSRGAIGTFAGEGHLAEPTSASAPNQPFKKAAESVAKLALRPLIPEDECAGRMR